MSMNKRENTNHSYIRAKERFGLNKETTKRMIKNAYLYGKPPSLLEDGRLKNILLNREKWKHKRIKVYNNKIFVFSKNSTRCITIYPVEIIESEKNKDE